MPFGESLQETALTTRKISQQPTGAKLFNRGGPTFD